MPFDPQSLPPGSVIFPTPTYFDKPQFFGRVADLNYVQNLLDAGSSIAISGKRRIGRSWFLKYLKTALPNDRYLVIESDELKPDAIVPRLPWLFLCTMIFELHAALHDFLPKEGEWHMLNPAEAPVNIGQAFYKDLGIINECLASAGLTAVILLDEAEALLEFKDQEEIVPSVERSLALSFPRIRVIVAGFDLRSPVNNRPALFDAFAHYQLYGIGPEGAYDLIVKQLRKFEVELQPPEIWAQVVSLTGGEPTLLRLMGQQLIEQARHNKGIITSKQLAIAIDGFFAMQAVISMMSYAWTFLGANQPIHALVTALAHANVSEPEMQTSVIDKVMRQFYSGTPPETIKSDLEHLCALGYLYRPDPADYFHFSSDLLRQWICRHRPDPFR
jgi:hypothetical protein